MDKKKSWESYRFPLILLAGIIIGALIGVIFGEKATVLQPVGQIFINLMFTIVVPMVFVSITSAVGSMLNMKRLGKILGSMVVTFIATGVCAAILVLVVVNIWPPAANTSISMGEATMQEATDISQMIVSTLTVDDFSGLMSRDNMLPMGATMHMDGSVLSSITKIAFLFGVFQMLFTGAGTYAMAIVVAVLSAFVLSGAPGGGLVGEMLIVSLFGFPGEAFPLIATIGFLVDPAATCLNSSGDTIASMIVARVVEGKDWLKKAAERKTAAQEI